MWIVSASIILALLILLAWILFAPILLVINSNTNQYELRWGKLAHLKWFPEKKGWPVQYRVLSWKKVTKLEDFIIQKIVKDKSEEKETEPKQAKKKRTSNKAKKWTFTRIKRKALRLLRSFQILHFKLNIDTDDYYYNSFLYPIFFFLNAQKRQIQVNYNEQLELELNIKNSVFKILKAFIF